MLISRQINAFYYNIIFTLSTFIFSTERVQYSQGNILGEIQKRKGICEQSQTSKNDNENHGQHLRTWDRSLSIAATASSWVSKCTSASPVAFPLELYSIVILTGFSGAKN